MILFSFILLIFCVRTERYCYCECTEGTKLCCSYYSQKVFPCCVAELGSSTHCKEKTYMLDLTTFHKSNTSLADLSTFPTEIVTYIAIGFGVFALVIIVVPLCLFCAFIGLLLTIALCVYCGLVGGISYFVKGEKLREKEKQIVREMEEEEKNRTDAPLIDKKTGNMVIVDDFGNVQHLVPMDSPPPGVEVREVI